MTTRPRFGLVDLCLLVLLAGAVALIGYRITVGLHYTWHWSTVGQYLFRYDRESGHWVANYLILGLLTTIRLSLYGGVLALVLGLILALARTGRGLFGRLLARTVIELMRNLPPLVIVFLVYFFLADQLTPIIGVEEWARGLGPAARQWLGWLVADPATLSPFLSAVATLAVFEAAYFAEILRAGIEGVDRGQWEAAQALGLSRTQTLGRIILPQGIRQVLPPLAGQGISLIKDSSIVSVISIQELTYQGTQMMASTYLTIEVWLLVALLYFALTFPCSLLVERLERRTTRTGRAVQ